MFGYISCDEEKLTPTERDIIGSFYCGLCFALKSHFGNRARTFTNIDCTYAYMLIASATATEIDIDKKRCFLHPFSKRNIAFVDDELSKKISSATILISYYKLLDDYKDERKNLTKSTMRTFFKKNARTASENLPEFDSVLNEMLKATQTLEGQDKDSLFELMDISGNILRAMAINCGAEALGELFFGLGRLVYFLDALDDYESDIKKKRYNALVYKFGNFGTKKELLLNKFAEIDSIFDDIYNHINNEYSSLKPDEPNPIFENLFTLGIRKCYNKAKRL